MTALNELSGVIISPCYPRHYPTNQSGSWEIKARIRENEVFLQLKTWIFLCNAVEYGQNGMTRTPTKRFLKIHFELAYYGFISYPFGTNRQICSYTTVAPSKTIPDSRPKWANSVTVFRPKRRKNHTLCGARYLYGLSKGFPPTRGINKPILGRGTLWF